MNVPWMTVNDDGSTWLTSHKNVAYARIVHDDQREFRVMLFDQYGRALAWIEEMPTLDEVICASMG